MRRRFVEMLNHTCPRCGNQIPTEQLLNGRAFCGCGWFGAAATGPSKRAVVQDFDRKIIIGMVSATVALIGLFAHFATWGSYGFALPVVRVQQMTGTLSQSGYEELAKVCLQIGKYDCAKEAYADEYAAKRDPATLMSLASLQSRLGEKANALKTVESYFQTGAKATGAALLHGQLLESFGRVDEAAQAYELAISVSTDTLPVTATTNLVHIYMKQGKYAKAYDCIEVFHASAGNAGGYLNTEKAQLQTYLRKQANQPSSQQKPARRPAKANTPKPIV